MEIMATSKNYGKKKGSDHFRDILNPYGEKCNYGKIGRRRRLSKLNVVFFSIILSVTIIIHNSDFEWDMNLSSMRNKIVGKIIELAGFSSHL